MTPNFTDDELRCKCGCGMLPKRDFMDKVQLLRNLVGFPLVVSSAARCPAHNAKVSGTADTGPHTTGRAIDIAIAGVQAFKLLEVAVFCGMFTGIGISQRGNSRFIHLDDLPDGPGCPRKRVWSY